MLREVLIAIIILLFFMIWIMTLALAFIGGFLYKGRTKPKFRTKKPTEADIRKAKRMQKEVENFMNYNGIPQEAINDYE